MTKINFDNLQTYLDLPKEKIDEYTNLLFSENESFSRSRFKQFYKEGEHFIGLSLYSYYPLFFREVIQVDKRALNELIKFSHYHFLSLFLFDQIYDANKIREPYEMIVLVQLYQKAAYYLKELTRSNKKIMDIVEENQIRNDVSMLNEKYVFKYEHHYDESVIKEYCMNKYVYAKSAIQIYSLYDSNVNQETIDKLNLSHDYFSIGRQYLDDSDDFEEDESEGGFNIYSYYFYKKHPNDIPLKTDNEILTFMVDEAKTNFKLAIDALQGLPETGWRRYLECYSNRINNFKVKERV